MTQIPAYFGSTEAPQSVSHQTKPDRRLLRVRDERPPSDGVADKCNEFPVASMASPLPRATPGRSKYISNPRMRTVLVPLQNRPLLMMMVRGGGFPTSPLAFIPIGRMGPPLRRFAADAHDCIMFGSLDLPHTRLRRDSTAPESAVPSDCHPRRTTVLEAVTMRPGEIEPRPTMEKMRHPA